MITIEVIGRNFFELNRSISLCVSKIKICYKFKIIFNLTNRSKNSNGLAYLIDRLKGQPLFANVKLEKGERSELANLVNELL